MMKHVDDVPNSARGFFDLRSQVNTGHGNNLERENNDRKSCQNTMTDYTLVNRLINISTCYQITFSDDK